MQKKRIIIRSLSLILCIVLIAAMALFTSGCGKDNNTNEGSEIAQDVSAATVLGEGKTAFNFIVTDADGNKTEYEIHTDKTTVGDALLELGLISGDQSEYGLYVKTVNGATLDYNKDGKFWSFYIEGEFAKTGVDATDIVAGTTYEFKVEKA